jgi:hypothetical protein
MDTQNVTFKETGKIAIGEIVVLVLMFLVFFLFNRFDTAVVWGGVLGAASNVLYFFFICIGVNFAVKETDAKRQKMSLTVTYYLRLIILGICIAVGLKLDCFNNIAVIVPVLMTRPILMVAEILGKGVKE